MRFGGSAAVATIARKDRNSEDWYLGAVTEENARALDLNLDFLDAGRTYTAEIYRDGDDADWRERPFSIAIEKRPARRGDAWKLRLAPGGGLAIRFRAKK